MKALRLVLVFPRVQVGRAIVSRWSLKPLAIDRYLTRRPSPGPASDLGAGEMGVSAVNPRPQFSCTGLHFPRIQLAEMRDDSPAVCCDGRRAPERVEPIAEKCF
jgi:hypothetical protein